MEHFIRIYDDVLSAEFCADVIRRFEASPHRFEGVCIGADNQPKVDPAHKMTTELAISNDPGWQDIDEVLKRNYVEYINRYSEEFPDISAIGGKLSSEEFRLKKYDVGGFFNWHIDCAGAEFHRLLAIQFYFNDVHEGGETEFEFQALKVKPVQGRLAIFPTLWTYRHRGARVVSNVKYVCTNYVQCSPDA